MNHKDKDVVDENMVGKSLLDFLKYYNKNNPTAFPVATHKALKVFMTTYPALFKDSEDWIVDKHRKKVMDWLASYTGEVERQKSIKS